MTSSPTTDSIDTLGVISAAAGALSGISLFYVVATLAFTLSFGIRLGYEHRIEKYLAQLKRRDP